MTPSAPGATGAGSLMSSVNACSSSAKAGDARSAPPSAIDVAATVTVATLAILRRLRAEFTCPPGSWGAVGRTIAQMGDGRTLRKTGARLVSGEHPTFASRVVQLG